MSILPLSLSLYLFSSQIPASNVTLCTCCLCRNSFKHNTSFVSRFSTIRRHKVSTPSHSHSPGIKQSGTGAGTSGCSTSTTHHQGHRTLTATSSLGASTNEPMATSRIHPSISNDSVTKEVSDASKRNSDGQLFFIIFYTLATCFGCYLIYLFFSLSRFNILSVNYCQMVVHVERTFLPLLDFRYCFCRFVYFFSLSTPLDSCHSKNPVYLLTKYQYFFYKFQLLHFYWTRVFPLPSKFISSQLNKRTAPNVLSLHFHSI